MKSFHPALLLVGTSLLISIALHAQTPSKPRRQFDIASIKPNNSGRPVVQTNPLIFTPGGRFTATNVTLVDVIVRVYPTRRIQMRGGPDWIDAERWDIIAKADEADGEIQEDERKQIVQTLLEDRFKLKFHVESQEMEILALVVGKGGPKLLPAKEGEIPGAFPADKPGSMKLQSSPISGLVNYLSNVLRTPIIDGTHITGSYDITFDLSRYLTPSDGSPQRRIDSTDRDQAYITEVQEELGLKLEKRKAALDITIIDRAERPSEN